MSVNGVSVLGPVGAGRLSEREDTRFQFRPVQKPSNAVQVGVIGYGYWGPNIVRNLQRLDNCELGAVCAKNPAALRRAGKTHTGVHLATDFSEGPPAPEIDAVAVFTPD